MIGVWCLRSECGLSKTLWFFYMMVERAVIAKIIPTTYWMGIPGSAQSLSHVGPFATPWTAAHQASLSISNSWSLLNLLYITLVMPSNHFILFCLLLVLPFNLYQHQGLFQWVSFSHQVAEVLEFQSGGQSIGVSALASVLPKNTRTDLL